MSLNSWRGGCIYFSRHTDETRPRVALSSDSHRISFSVQIKNPALLDKSREFSLYLFRYFFSNFTISLNVSADTFLPLAVTRTSIPDVGSYSHLKRLWTPCGKPNKVRLVESGELFSSAVCLACFDVINSHKELQCTTCPKSTKHCAHQSIDTASTQVQKCLAERHHWNSKFYPT